MGSPVANTVLIFPFLHENVFWALFWNCLCAVLLIIHVAQDVLLLFFFFFFFFFNKKVSIFFFFFPENIYCGNSLEVLH